jgi:predicted GNAT family N-acyltransferase
MPIRFTRITTWQESEPLLRAIRTAVFIKEQHIPEALEWDDEDSDAIHFLVRTENGDNLATARLVYESPVAVRIGRFAVLPSHRKMGIASGLLRFIIGFAKSQGVEDILLSAQVAVQELYEKEGFSPQGEPYQEAGIPHIKMCLHIRDKKSTVSETLGSDERVHRFHNIDEYRTHLQTIIPQARQTLCILTPDMEFGTLDSAVLLESISQFARQSSSTRVRLLTADDKAPVNSGNKLLKLARRLPSRFDFRVLKSQTAFPEQVYTLVDDQGIVLRHTYTAWEGFCCYKDPGLVKRMREDFDRWWGQSRLSYEFRQMRL